MRSEVQSDSEHSPRLIEPPRTPSSGGSGGPASVPSRVSCPNMHDTGWWGMISTSFHSIQHLPYSRGWRKGCSASPQKKGYQGRTHQLRIALFDAFAWELNISTWPTQQGQLLLCGPSHTTIVLQQVSCMLHGAQASTRHELAEASAHCRKALLQLLNADLANWSQQSQLLLRGRGTAS